MTDSVEELWRTLNDVRAMPYGAGQVAAVEQLVRRVDAVADPHLAFATRMVGTTAYVYGGEPAKSFVTFSWCLADFDRQPQPYHQHFTHALLWHFKYMVNALLKFPEVPLDRTFAVLDDMERRYREGGHSLQAVYKHRHLVARHLGRADEAEEWYRRWTTTARDDLSDCAGCDPSAQVTHLASTGRDAEAVTLAEPVLSGRLSCTEQPQGILTSLLLPYLRTGRRAEARDAHRRAYRRIRANLADLGDVGDHVEFCALTGNDLRGLEIVERHLDWLDRAPSPAAALEFASAAVLVLRHLAADGHDGLTVHRRGHGDRPAADLPLAVLAEELADLSSGLAARFDTRNGTPAHTRWLERRWSAEPVGESLPLSATARPRAGTAVPGPRPGDQDTGPRDVATRPASRPAPVPEPPADATPADLLDLADGYWAAERSDGLEAALRAFDDRFGDAELEPGVAARRVEFRAVQLRLADDLTGAASAHEEAAALFRRAGDPVGEATSNGRLGVVRCLAGEPDEGVRLASAAAGTLAAAGDAGERATGYDRLALALLVAQRLPEALDAADRATAEVADADDPRLAARIALRRTACLEAMDRPEEFRAAAAHARELLRDLDLPGPYAAACLAHARALDDPAEALAAYDEALPDAPAEALLAARTGRARALMALDRVDEAVDDLVESVGLCVERGVADGSAFLRWELAAAYRRAGRMLDAAETAEEAVAELDRLGFQADADRCRHLLAGVYVALDEDEAALALLDQLAGNLDGPDNLPGRGQVLEEAGDLLYRRDRDEAAAGRFARAAESYRLAGLTLDELRARRREVEALHWADRTDQAAAALAGADRVVAALVEGAADEPPVRWERSMLDHAAARLLAGLDRADEALDRLHGVPERLRSIEAFGEALQVELLTGEILLRLGRLDDAELLLRRTLAALPTGSPAVQRAAWLLAQVLRRTGRADEADALLSQHDIHIED